jgi:hypothetical protein
MCISIKNRQSTSFNEVSIFFKISSVGVGGRGEEGDSTTRVSIPGPAGLKDVDGVGPHIALA